MPTAFQSYAVFFVLYLSILFIHDAAENRTVTKFLSAAKPVKLQPYTTPITSRDQVTFPSPLSAQDVTLYTHIFQLQQQGKWPEADLEIAKLESPILKGYVLAQRYLHKSYVPTEEELLNWIDLYSDHPQAHAVYKVAAQFNPTYGEVGQEMKKDYLSGFGDNSVQTGSIEYMFDKAYWGDRTEARAIWRKVNHMVSAGRVKDAHRQLHSEMTNRLFKDKEIGMANWAIANGYFAQGNDAQAYRAIIEAIRDANNAVPEMYNSAGIIAWRLERLKDAASHFEHMSEAKGASEWDASAGAFWAYRSYKRLSQLKKSQAMLERAAEYPRTFYGMLALKLLGRPLDAKWKWPTLDENQRKNVLLLPGIKRSLALRQLGMRKEAEEELRKLFPQLSRSMKQTMISVAREMGYPVLELRMSSMIFSRGNYNHDYAAYPMPPWKPENGFIVDPALLFGIARHESGFYASVKSKAGAVGVMQLLPKTASFISRQGRISYKESDLTDPVKNLTLGQEYVKYLLKKSDINGNLFLFLAAYNAGETKLIRWLDDTKFKNDPLLFIESIPVRETRNYIERVMANYWMYRDRLGESSTSMDDIANGKWPYYE